MKIKGWSIDGFGIFHDYALRGLGDGLTIFHGPNEAGKSTLLAFVRGVLFGFPDGRSTEPRYPPLRGGRHGGRLFVSTPAGDWVVERLAGRRPPLALIGPDDQPRPEAALRELVGGADERLFRTVFAFSLAELQSFDALSAEGVRERIFSAGISGAARPVRDAIRELDTQASALLKPRGQGRVNVLVAELKDLEGRIDSASRTAAGFGALLAEGDRRAAEVDRLAREIALRRANQARLLRLIDLSPDWQKQETTRAEIERLEIADDFPADGEARLAALLLELRSTSRSMAEAADARRALERRRDEIAQTTDDRLQAAASEVEALFEALSLHRDLLDQMPAIEARLTLASQSIDQGLRALGSAWNEESIASFDRLAARQDEVRAHEQRLAEASANLERASQDVAVTTRRRDELQEARDRLTAPDAGGAWGDEGELQVKALRRLRTRLGELQGAELDRATQEAIAHERDRSLRLLQADRRPSTSAGPTSAVVIAIVVIALALWRASTGDLSRVELLVATIGLAALGVYAWRGQRMAAAARARRDSEIATLLADRNEAVSFGDAQRRRAAEIAQTIATEAATLGIQPPPTLQSIEEREADLLRRQAERQALENASGPVSLALEALSNAQFDVYRAIGLREQARRDDIEARAEWLGWKARLLLPEQLSPQEILALFESIRATQDALATRQTTRAEAAALAQRIDAWQRRARAVLETAGSAPDPDASRLIDEVLALRKRIADDREARQTIEALGVDLQSRATSLAALERDRDATIAERDRLFARSGAADEAAFRRGCDTFRRKAALRAALDGLAHQIAARIGEDPEAAAVREALATGHVTHWHEQAAALERQIEEIQRQRDQAVAAHRDVERERIAIESSADVARLEIEREGLVTELRAVVREWQTTSLASALIEEALEIFERTRQPEVLATASTTFGYITKGRYPRIVQEEEAQTIMVVDRDGGRRPAESLSRGTAEQLYVCIRFALAAEFGRRSERLPIVMDDVFVNFDVDRAESMAYVVDEIAQYHQVLLFTCHTSTRDLLHRVVSAADIVELTPVEPAGVPMGPVQVRPVRPPVEPQPPAPVAGDAPEAAPRDTTTRDLLENVPPMPAEPKPPRRRRLPKSGG